jgi:hypothetical protein
MKNNKKSKFYRMKRTESSEKKKESPEREKKSRLNSMK